MIDRRAAEEGIGQDSALVRLEVARLGIDRDGDGLLDDCRLERSVAVWSDFGVGGGADVGCLGGNVGASTIRGGVGVSVLKIGTMARIVVEGVALPAAVATEARLDTVDELLLRELLHSARAFVLSDVVGRLQATHGGEGPAGTALTLVLDWRHCTSRDPVNTHGPVWHGSQILMVLNRLVLLRHLGGSEHLGALVLSPVREEVVTVDGRSLKRVDLLDLSIALLEDLESHLVLLLGGVSLRVLSDVVNELELDGLERSGGSNASDGSNNE